MPAQEGPILITEDAIGVAELLKSALHINGYAVVTAGDEIEVHTIINSRNPSLLITDILPPKLNGYLLVQKIRSDPATAHIPVILVSTSYTTAEDKKFAASLGGIRFIEKPIDIDDFLLTVGEILIHGISTTPKPMSTEEFYRGYRDRLETSLRHKYTQIARAERLLQTLPDNFKPAFETILSNSIKDRNQIADELEKIYDILTEFRFNSV